MASRRVSLSSSNSENVQQISRASTAFLKYSKYLENSTDGKVKWLGDLKELKQLISDIFGDDGKWSSPGGSTKAFRNDKITITWYVNKKSLLFQGQLGNILKTQILNLNIIEDIVVNDDLIDVSEESESNCTECRRLSMEMAEVKLDIEILRVTLNRCRESLTKLEGGLKKSAEERREVGTQTVHSLEPTSPTCPVIDITSSVLVFSTQETNIHSSNSFADQMRDERKYQSEIIYSTISTTSHIDTPISPQVDSSRSYESPLKGQFINKRATYPPRKQISRPPIVGSQKTRNRGFLRGQSINIRMPYQRQQRSGQLNRSDQSFERLADITNQRRQSRQNSFWQRSKYNQIDRTNYWPNWKKYLEFVRQVTRT